MRYLLALRKRIYTIAELEVALAAGEGRVRRAVDRGELDPDHSITIGDRTYYYFSKERKEEIRQSLNLPRVNDESIKGLFLQFVRKMDMVSSYKPVFLQAFLQECDTKGRAKITAVAESFKRYYENRMDSGQTIEKPSLRMASVDALNIDEIKQILLAMPFEKFERRHYLRYARDLAYIEFNPKLWRHLTTTDLDELHSICNESIAKYYDRIDTH